MYKNNQLWNIYILRSQRISYRYRETPRCLSIYIIDLNQFLLLFLLTITQQKYFSSLPKFLFNYIVFESILLLVVRPWYSKNYIATISCTWEWASNFGAVAGELLCIQKQFFLEQSIAGGNSSIGNFIPFFPLFLFLFFLFVFILFYCAVIVAWAFELETREVD